MRKSNLEISATLEIMIYASRYFQKLPSDLKERKKVLKHYNNIKLRMKLLVNDILGHLERAEGYKPGISVGLKKEQKKNEKIKGVWEHTIPWEEFFYYLMKRKFKDPEELYKYFKITYCQCRITPEEHEKLKKAGFDKKMPEGWKNWMDRYDSPKVKIELVELPKNPSNPSLHITNDLF